MMESAKGPPFDPALYPDFATFERWVKELTSAFPDLVQLTSIGQSHQGRPIYLLTVTNSATGLATEKAGFYVDAATHAEELVGTNVVMYLAWHLLSGFGNDPLCTRLLDTTAFFIVPRLNPDGAETCIASDLPWVGNGRYLPGEEQIGPGFHFHDVDGDGFVTQMRVPDPLGEWKISDRDARLLIPRLPDEEGGTYFRLLPEGLIRNFDGAAIEMVIPRDGNLNRNYPGNWFPESLQYGAGTHPASEPETKAVVDLILAHPYIGGINTFHTHGGLILRPLNAKSDEHMHPEDLVLYERLGAMGTEETGYPLVSTYHGFTPDKTKVRGGCLDDWTYEELGIISFTTELWDVYKEAGTADPVRWGIHSEADGLLLLAWNDQVLAGQGFVPWRTWAHPQLGQVEIGGWKRTRVFRNPPGQLVRQIAQNSTRFVLRHASSLPRLRIADLVFKPLSGDALAVTAVVENTGFLPTFISHQALDRRCVNGVTVSIELEGATLVHGEASQDLGHLSGRSERRGPWTPFISPWGTPRRATTWVIIPTAPGAQVRVVAQGGRAGRAVATAAL